MEARGRKQVWAGGAAGGRAAGGPRRTGGARAWERALGWTGSSTRMGPHPVDGPIHDPPTATRQHNQFQSPGDKSGRRAVTRM